MTDDFSERAAQVEKMLRAGTTAFLLVTSAQREPIDEAIWFRRTLEQGGLPFAGVIVNRVHHDMLGEAEPDDLVTALDAELAPELAARVAENFFDYHVLARRDARNIARLAGRAGRRARCCSSPTSTTTSTTSRACCGCTATCSRSDAERERLIADVSPDRRGGARPAGVRRRNGSVVTPGPRGPAEPRQQQRCQRRGRPAVAADHLHAALMQQLPHRLLGTASSSLTARQCGWAAAASAITSWKPQRRAARRSAMASLSASTGGRGLGAPALAWAMMRVGDVGAPWWRVAQPRPMPSSSGRSSGPSRIVSFGFAPAPSGGHRARSTSPPTHGRRNRVVQLLAAEVERPSDMGELAQLEVEHLSGSTTPASRNAPGPHRSLAAPRLGPPSH